MSACVEGNMNQS
uniref:Uncharacterized protein n=1 Tax=Arundo donax TaxID=35708 RepID=A0A0A9HLZ2_ARUDO